VFGGKKRDSQGLRAYLTGLSHATKLLTLGAVLLQWGSAVPWDWPAGPVARILIGVITLGIVVFQLFNCRLRAKLKQWKNESLARLLRGELLLGCGAPATVLAVALLAPPDWRALLATGVVIVVAASLYEPLEESIHEIIEEDDELAHGTTYFAKCQPLKKIGIERRIEEMAGLKLGIGLQRFLAFWVKPSWRPGLSRTRIVLIYSMLACFVIAVGAAGNVAIREQVVHHHARTDHAGGGNGSGSGASSGRGDAGGGSESGGGEGGGSGQAKSSRGPCLHLPSFGAPAWARRDLDALYYGGEKLAATPPPGNVGGCTGRAIVPTAQHGTFVYVIGRNSLGEILSIAVDSLEFGPQIFLSPGAKRVLALIRSGYAPLGGYPTETVAGGDYAPVTTEQGTIVYVRGGKHLPGRANVAMPYVELDPPVAIAWLDKMASTESWLWPLPPVAHGGAETFGFVLQRAETEPAFTITYEPATGTARLDGRVYGPQRKQLDAGELRRMAELAF